MTLSNPLAVMVTGMCPLCASNLHRALAVDGADGVAQLRNDMAHAGVAKLSNIHLGLFDVAHRSSL
jgi:hypothetical protein